MTDRLTVLKGTIHGKTIQLEQEPGLPDGQLVQVEIRVVEASPAWLDRIVIDTAVLPRQPIIKGTRIPAESLVTLLDQGQSEEDLRRAYPELTPEDIAAVQQYACVPQGLRRSFGGWAEGAEELDKYLEWNRQQRKVERCRMDE